MPHLQEKNDAEENVHDSQGTKGKMPGNTEGSGSDLPIKEAAEGYLNGSEGLSDLTMKATNTSSPRKVQSFESRDEHHSPEDASTPQTNQTRQSVITPSPFGLKMRYGPVMTIYGNKKLVPSPIRVKRRVSNSEEDNKDERPESPSPPMGQPRNLQYGDSYTTPLKKVSSDQCADEREGLYQNNKRPAGQSSFDVQEKRPKLERAVSGSLQLSRSSSSMAEHELPNNNPAPGVPKKVIISPTSSGEKGEDEDSTGTAPKGTALPFGGRTYPHLSYPPPGPYAPHHPAYAGHPPPYPGAFPVYSGYPRHPPPPYFSGHPTAPYYPPYPPQYPMMHHARPPPKFPAPFGESPHRIVAPPAPLGMVRVTSGELSQEGSTPEKAVPAPVGSSKNDIKSVAEWQQAALSSGKPPSANRCVPLKEPIPSKYWGNAEKTKDANLPDFHRLVNYPDYLAKARTSTSGSDSSTTASCGKKNCVMCGKLRVCSATSLVNRGRTIKADDLVSVTPEDDESTAHIIPRQNKGLCTACDVTVWVVVSDGLEIKWCKGCKNFRPWAAFGDKGSATKCVRCRDRQREKYAMQKDEIRLRRYKRTSSCDSSSPVPMSKNTDENEDNHMAAARGLRNLMNAASV